MTAEPAPPLMTAEQLLCLPDNGSQHELEGGRLIRMAPASSKPSIVAMRAGSRLSSFVEAYRLGVCGGADWGFRLWENPDTVRAPDVGFVSAERIPAEGIPAGYWPGAPDLAIEVISPSNRLAEVLKKVSEYLTAGTRLVWVLYPEERIAVIYRATGTTEIAGETGTLSGEDVVPGFALALTDIWV